MQGQIKDQTYWDITQEENGDFTAERIQRVTVSAENLAEAKAKLMVEFGGKVDPRGWHRQGASGQNLKKLVDLRNLIAGEHEGNGTERILAVH